MISQGARTKAVFLTRQARFACQAAPPGYRDRNNGKIFGVGAYGDCWSSTALGSNAAYLAFCSAWFHTEHIEYRAYSIPLRCLQE